MTTRMKLSKQSSSSSSSSSSGSFGFADSFSLPSTALSSGELFKLIEASMTTMSYNTRMHYVSELIVDQKKLNYKLKAIDDDDTVDELISLCITHQPSPTVIVHSSDERQSKKRTKDKISKNMMDVDKDDDDDDEDKDDFEMIDNASSSSSSSSPSSSSIVSLFPSRPARNVSHYNFDQIAIQLAVATRRTAVLLDELHHSSSYMFKNKACSSLTKQLNDDELKLCIKKNRVKSMKRRLLHNCIRFSRKQVLSSFVNDFLNGDASFFTSIDDVCPVLHGCDTVTIERLLSQTLVLTNPKLDWNSLTNEYAGAAVIRVLETQLKQAASSSSSLKVIDEMIKYLSKHEQNMLERTEAVTVVWTFWSKCARLGNTTSTSHQHHHRTRPFIQNSCLLSSFILQRCLIFGIA